MQKESAKAIGLLQSKTVWVAFLMLIFSILRFFGVGLPDELASEIVNQDWTNVVQALVSVAVLIMRTLFLGAPVKGWWVKSVASGAK